MSSLKILIVEDDISFAIELEILVKEIGYQVMGAVETGEDAINIIENQHPDLIFMDINLTGKLSGMDVAERIQHLKIPILFITSFADKNLYLQSKEYNSKGYLVKPIDSFSLYTAIDLVIQNIENERVSLPFAGASVAYPFIYLKKKDTFHKVFLQEILFFKMDRNYVDIYTKDDYFITRTPMKNMEQLAQGTSFLKVHRSYLINLKKITSLNLSQNKITLDSHVIPVNQAAKTILREVMKDLIF